MVFNWFRRRFDETPKAPQAEADTAEKETAQQPQTEEPQGAAADYLSWAKAAYQNIQQTQSTAAPQTEGATEESQAPGEEADSGVTPETVVAGVAQIPETASLEEATAEAPEPPESSLTEGKDQETLAIATPPEQPEVAEPGQSTNPVVPVDATPPTGSTGTKPSFLARAEVERKARMQRIKDTAIAEPEPASQTVTAPPETPAETPAQIPLAFDEGFLWSAELLAAQGRRPDQVSVEEITWLKRLRQGLDKTRRTLVNQLKAIVGQGPLNQDAVTEIETLLLQADVGVEATDTIIQALQNKLRSEVLPPDAAIAYLKQLLRDMLDAPLRQVYSPTFAPEKDTLNIWLLTGVNGAGKTTTLGKIAHIAKESDYCCLIAAADTFRAAAVEQVKIWGQRSGIEVIANQGQNSDPAAVVFDAIAAAQARGVELLLVDTAGRLQNKKNLMDELSKIRRIMDKKAAGAKIESLLVLDATLGQNGLRQAQVFSEAAQLTGVVLTKLDGTAKGGIALAVVQQLGLPIRFIGAGEGIKDLRPFSSYEFVEALLSG